MDLKTSSPLISAARKDGDALVVAVRGEVDLNNSPGLRTDLLDLLVRHAPKKLVLNLTQVPYMDSSAIAVLVEALRKVRVGGGKIFLTDLQPRVRGLIEIARLNTIFVLVADEAQALAS
jgi:anti-sigma B factor antagonist